MIVRNKTVRLIKMGELKLMPGMNEVSAKQMEEHKGALEYHREHRNIEMPKLEIEDDLEEGISQFNANDAITLIEETHSEDKILEYREEEKEGKSRKKVLAAIDRKLKELSDAMTKEDGDKEEF